VKATEHIVEGAPVKTPPGTVSEPAKSEQMKPVPVPDRPAQANGWHVLDPDIEVGTVPKDGNTVWVADAKGNMCEAVWRRSRQFGMEKNSYGKWIGRWKEAGYWAILNFSGAKVPFVPKHWHELIK
jgi:hypothetical protein